MEPRRIRRDHKTQGPLYNATTVIAPRRKPSWGPLPFSLQVQSQFLALRLLRRIVGPRVPTTATAIRRYVDRRGRATTKSKCATSTRTRCEPSACDQPATAR
jgi:hypothetical protein